MSKYRWWRNRPNNNYSPHTSNSEVTIGTSTDQIVLAQDNIGQGVNVDINGNLMVNETDVQTSIEELSTRVTSLEAEDNLIKRWYNGGEYINPMHNGINRAEALDTLIQSTINLNNSGVMDIDDPNNVLVNIIRNVMTEMRNRGEI